MYQGIKANDVVLMTKFDKHQMLTRKSRERGMLFRKTVILSIGCESYYNPVENKSFLFENYTIW